MANIFFVKFFNILRFLLYKAVNLTFFLIPQIKSPKTLLLIRLDSIGDYILVRDFIRIIKKSKKFYDYKITLCGNILWKDIALTFDSEIIDEFIWIDRKKFNDNPFYKFNVLKQVYRKGFEVAIDTTYSREILYGDSIVNTSRAKEKIGSAGSLDSYMRWKRILFTNKYYTNLIPHSPKNLFEFYRNKEFFENIFQEKTGLIKPSLNCSKIEINLPTSKKYAVIFPGAQEKKRRWASMNFEVVIEQLIKKYRLEIIIAGSLSDSAISRRMLKCHNSKECFDMTGKTTLPQLAKLISQAQILISNETSAVHFAAAVGTPFICISNGNHYGRFNPYPEEMNIKCRYIYPEDIEKNLSDQTYLEKYRFDSNLDINSISSDKILKVLPELL